METLNTLGEDDPLIRSMVKAAGGSGIHEIAGKLEELEAQADRAGFLQTPTVVDGVRRQPNSSDSDHDPICNVGSYRLIRQIGRGGFGRVFEGFHTDFPNRKVAVKVYENRWLDGIERLEIEKLVLQKLDHPNLVTALDAGVDDDGTHFLVMNLIDGVRIDEFVRQQKLGFSQIARLFAQIAEAMEYSHSQDVVHRDLKPGNILITADGVPVVTDFGLAKRINLKAGRSVTATGALVGTLGYLAPEQADMKRREVTRSVDVYGLGATLYHLLTGRAPFERDNLLKALDELKTDPPIAPRAINGEIPADLERVCLKCLAKLPLDRYESMHFLADDLQRFVDGQPVWARSLNLSQQTWRWCRTNPLVSGLAISLAMAVVSGLIASLILWRHAATQQTVTAGLLAKAIKLSQADDQAAETMLVQTPETLEFRYQRLLNSVNFLDGLIEQFPDDDNLYRESATSQFRLGKVVCRQGKWQEGREAYETALHRFRNLAERYPADHSLQFDVFHSLLGLDNVDRSLLGLPSEEEGKLTEALDIIEQLVAVRPDYTDYRDALICTQNLVVFRRFPEDSLEVLTFLHGVYKQAVILKSEFPEPCLQWRHVGLTAHRLAAACLLHEDFDQSEEWLATAFRETREFLTRPDLDPGEYIDLAECLKLAHKLANKKCDFKKADGYSRQWRESMSVWAETYPDYHVFRDELSRSAEYFANGN